MATATRQNHGGNGAGVTTLAITITATLSGSVISVGTATGNTNTQINCNAPTDSGVQTYGAAVAQVGVTASAACSLRIDDVLNSASGVTTVTLHCASSAELSGDVHEITGTNNTRRGTPPAGTTGSTASLATNSIVASAGDVLAAFITDGGGTNTQYTTSPVAYVVDSGAVPNGSNERAGGAHADNVSAATLACTFGLPGAASCAAAQVGYQAAAGATNPIGYLVSDLENSPSTIVQSAQVRAAYW